jgi:hypothetical protein
MATKRKDQPLHNRKRAAQARTVLHFYRDRYKQGPEPLETLLTDLLTNAMHNFGAGEVLRLTGVALMHYSSEAGLTPAPDTAIQGGKQAEERAIGRLDKDGNPFYLDEVE